MHIDNKSHRDRKKRVMDEEIEVGIDIAGTGRSPFTNLRYKYNHSLTKSFSTLSARNNKMFQNSLSFYLSVCQELFNSLKGMFFLSNPAGKSAKKVRSK